MIASAVLILQALPLAFEQNKLGQDLILLQVYDTNSTV